MDDGEVELPGHGLLPNPNSSGNTQTSESIDTFLNEFLKNTRTCTHTHACNPPGPDAAHTHTCYHTHTQVFPSAEEDDAPAQSNEHSRRDDEHLAAAKPRRTSGNREAVRKYREKKKAQTAYLEEEVKKLRILNQQLVRKLQGQAILEAEVSRLRSLLIDLRGKIDDELGVFPFEKQCNAMASFKEGDCGVQSNGGGMNLQCENDVLCFHPQPVTSSLRASDIAGWSEKRVVSRGKNCQPAVIDCRASVEGCSSDAVETVVSSSSQAK